MRTAFLASVTSGAEAAAVVAGGVDIVDCKNPSAGALGALPVATVAAIRQAVARTIPVSATIGDLPADPGELVAATRAMAASGCNLVKIGFFPGGDAHAAVAALGALDLGPARLVGLLLADREPDFTLIEAMAEARFAGIMLDTAAKTGAALPDMMDDIQLSHFIARARTAGLFAGIAGALRLSHIGNLMRLKPNLIGFRGALCAASERTGRIDPAAVRAVRHEIDRHALAHVETAHV
jgi:(5-formylfuran-3-yl)methyl phosphate synthase